MGFDADNLCLSVFICGSLSLNQLALFSRPKFNDTSLLERLGVQVLVNVVQGDGHHFLNFVSQ